MILQAALDACEKMVHENTVIAFQGLSASLTALSTKLPPSAVGFSSALLSQRDDSLDVLKSVLQVVPKSGSLRETYCDN